MTEKNLNEEKRKKKFKFNALNLSTSGLEENIGLICVLIKSNDFFLKLAGKPILGSIRSQWALH